MSKRFHPVSLHVIRGALLYGGFEPGKIRQIGTPDANHAVAVYDVSIRAIRGMIQGECPPNVVYNAARACFAHDVTVARVLFDGTAYSLRLVTRVLNDDPMVGDGSAGDSGALDVVFDADYMEAHS